MLKKQAKTLFPLICVKEKNIVAAKKNNLKNTDYKPAERGLY
jgi:hypothetical protein